ncbi:MAG: DUF1549 and DUF1553 domain-containing protein [bacterium]|nr:DUF1549 and DUF1553 domain-containing protein [bacterium]
MHRLLLQTICVTMCLGPVVLAEEVVLAETAVEFSVDVMSILSKSGCNMGTCHGNLNGKGGFKLSLRGQDPYFDYQSLVHAARGRRINLTAPEESLILKKATGAVSHRGGVRMSAASAEYQQLVQWIQQGTQGPSPHAPRVKQLVVSPADAVIPAPLDSAQVLVTAIFENGAKRNVTERACYELSNLKAQVSPSGRVTRSDFGETTLIVRYLDEQVAVPLAFTTGEKITWQEPQAANFIDRHVNAKLRRLMIPPSPICDDSVFIRRVYLDATGRLPTADEAKTFVEDPNTNKRQEAVDRLLATPAFADYWALKFADMLRTEEKVLDVQGVEVFHAWIRENIRRDTPLDQFVRELITGTGSTFEQPAANFYRANRDPATRGETAARLFLGTRLQCAKCHNHPFDRWTQEDYYQWSNLFSQLDYEVGENKRRDRLDKNEFVGDQIVLVAKQDEVRNPTTGKVAIPKFLGGPQLDANSDADRRQALAVWLTDPGNELFVQSQANFIWYQLMGQGLVDPIDDFRMTNPATNPALLEALADHFVESNFSVRKLVRTIMLSRTYQRASEPLPSNASDTTCYSHVQIRRLPAEVLLDMQSDFLGAPAEFVGYPEGIRAVQIPGVQRVRPRDKAPKAGDRFLKTFGKPPRIMACDCERSNETNLQQVLSLLGAGLDERLTQSPRLEELSQGQLSDSQVIEQLYWSALSRSPSTSEFEAAHALLRDPKLSRQAAIQDLAWALLNAKEFVFRR